MSLWSERFKSHLVWNMLMLVEQEVAELAARPSPELAEDYARLRKVLAYFRRVLESADPDLVPLAPLDKARDYLTGIKLMLPSCGSTQTAHNALMEANNRATYLLEFLPFFHSGTVAPPVALPAPPPAPVQVVKKVIMVNRVPPLAGPADPIDTSPLVHKGIHVKDMVAYPQGLAAQVIGISRSSLYREIKRRKIFPTKQFGLISREELVRYLREETQLAKRRKRFPRINGTSTTSAGKAEPSSSEQRTPTGP